MVPAYKIVPLPHSKRRGGIAPPQIDAAHRQRSAVVEAEFDDMAVFQGEALRREADFRTVNALARLAVDYDGDAIDIAHRVVVVALAEAGV